MPNERWGVGDRAPSERLLRRGAAKLPPAVAAALTKAGKKEGRPADGTRMEGKEDAGSEANDEAADEASACARLLLAAFSSASSEEGLVVALDALRAAVENEEVPLAKHDVVAIARPKKAEGAVEWTRAVAAALGALLKSFGGRSRVDPLPFPSACPSPTEAAFEWTGGGDPATAQGHDNYTPILGSVGFAPNTGVYTWSIVGTCWRRAVAGVCMAAATKWLGNNRPQPDAWCYTSQAEQGGWIEVWHNAPVYTHTRCATRRRARRRRLPDIHAGHGGGAHPRRGGQRGVPRRLYPPPAARRHCVPRSGLQRQLRTSAHRRR